METISYLVRDHPYRALQRVVIFSCLAMRYGLLLQAPVTVVFMLGMLGVERCRKIYHVDIEITSYVISI